MAINNPDKINITDVEITPSVTPGGRIALSWAVDVGKGAIQPPPFGAIWQHEDYCTAGNLGGGVRLIVRIRMGQSVMVEREVCWPMQSTNRVDRADFIAPTDPGEVGVSIEVFGSTDDDFVDSQTEAVEVLGSGDNGDVIGSCPTGYERDQSGQCVPVGGTDDPIFPDDGIIGNLEGIGMVVVLGIGGLIVLKGMDMVDQPEDAADAAPQASEVKGVPLPLDQREPDTDDSADAEGE